MPTPREHPTPEQVLRVLAELVGVDAETLQECGLLGAYLAALERAREQGGAAAIAWRWARVERLASELLLANAVLRDADFRKLIGDLCSPEPSNGFGARAELLALSYLFEDVIEGRGLSPEDIAKGESPDYRVSWRGDVVGVEVTSTYVDPGESGIDDRNRLDKVKRAVKRKAKKGYVDRSTVLVVEISNIFHESARAGRPINGDDVEQAVLEVLPGTPFGAVVAVFFVANDEGKYLPRYSSHVHNQAHDCARSFIEAFYANKPETLSARFSRLP